MLAAGLVLSFTEVSFASPWPRVIIGLLVFTLPGGCLFALVPPRDSWDIIDFVGFGFAFSVALITLLGLITRTLALSIDVIEIIWYLLAILGFAAVLYKSRQFSSVSPKLYAPVVLALAIILIQVAFYTHSSIFATSTTNDQNRHHAAVNGFLRDEPLGWAEPYYETGNPIADRMYLTYWVLAQALVVEISGVPILLTRYLINPFVMVMSVVAMYVFARNLGHERKSSLVYVILGLFAYSMVSDYSIQSGAQFYVRPLLDKIVAAFALAPVAISCAWLCANTGSGRAYFGFGLSFLATVSVHAIPGGFAAVIVGLFCLIRLLTDRVDWRNSLKLLILLTLLFAPAIFVRLNTWESTIYYFDELPEETGSNIHVYEAVNPLDNGNNLYAIHSNMAGALTYLLVVFAALSVAARRLDSRSKLMLAYVIAIGIGLLPYTAWIYGRLVSFYHIVRILWLMPYGYMLGFTLATMSTLLGRSLSANSRILGWLASDRVLYLLLTIVLLLTAHFLRFSHGFDLSRDISHSARGDVEWLEIAEYLDANHDERVWIAASPESRSRAITLNWKVVELSRFSAERMSYYSKLPLAQAESQLNDNLRLYSADVSVEEKLAIVDRYGIDYLLFPKGYAWMIDALYQMDKQRFELVHSGETLRLVRAHKKSS
ncbi:MAG: hypothetical protein OXG78_05575 [Chloroflexi bacterium]|nr:hypothetical protein [Chloroflexota bacterium]